MAQINRTTKNSTYWIIHCAPSDNTFQISFQRTSKQSINSHADRGIDDFCCTRQLQTMCALIFGIRNNLSEQGSSWPFSPSEDSWKPFRKSVGVPPARPVPLDQALACGGGGNEESVDRCHSRDTNNAQDNDAMLALDRKWNEWWRPWQQGPEPENWWWRLLNVGLRRNSSATRFWRHATGLVSTGQKTSGSGSIVMNHLTVRAPLFDLEVWD